MISHVIGLFDQNAGLRYRLLFHPRAAADQTFQIKSWNRNVNLKLVHVYGNRYVLDHQLFVIVIFSLYHVKVARVPLAK